MSNSQAKPVSLTGKMMVAFDGLQKREQNLLFFGVPITILVVVYLLFAEPEFKKMQRLNQSTASLDKQLVLAQQSKQELLSLAELDPNTEVKAQIDSLQRRLDQLSQEFEGELSQLVSPQAMPVLLEQLFFKAENLSVLTMKSIAPEKISLNKAGNGNSTNANAINTNAAGAQSNSPSAIPIFRHGIEITFEGSFFATRDFLAEAQNLGWKLYWQDLSYEVAEHPKAVTHLTLFTLSTSEAFIGVN